MQILCSNRKAPLTLSLIVIVIFISAAHIQGQCTKDTDCKGDRICVDGECIFPPETVEDNTCAKDIDCEGDMICVDGKCVEPEEKQNTSAPVEPAQQQPEIQPVVEQQPSKQEEQDKQGRVNLLIHPLGFLQFGPIVGTEIRVGQSMFIDIHFRYAALGLLYNLIVDGDTKMYSMAAGLGTKWLIKRRNSPHGFYIGGFTDFGWGANIQNEGYSDEWEGEHKYFAIASTEGFRWRFSRGFILNLGLMAGIAFEIEDDWEYTDYNHPDYGEKKYSDEDVYFFGMVEVSLGWEFGKK